MQTLAIIEVILRDRQRFFKDIRQEEGLIKKIGEMAISCLLFFALYGAVLGSTHSWEQTVSSAVKLPMLFLATIIVCFPMLYFLNIFLGAPHSAYQYLGVILAALNVSAFLLFSFAPIVFFFMLSLGQQDYTFFKLMNVAIFALAGMVGWVSFRTGIKELQTSSTSLSPDIYEGVERERTTQASYQTKKDRSHGFLTPKSSNTLIYMWLVLYAVVGAQMAWTLRPFIGYPDAPFELIRQIGGNFYADLLLSIGEILGFVGVK